MASCTAITFVHGNLIGDPMDVKMFEATEWVLDEPDGKQASDNELVIGTMYPPDLGHRQVPGLISSRTETGSDSE